MQTNEAGQFEIRLCGEKDVEVLIVPNHLERVKLIGSTDQRGHITGCQVFYKEFSLLLEVEMYHLLDQVDRFSDVSFVALKKAGITSPVEPLVAQANAILKTLKVAQRLVVEKRRVKIK